VPAALGPSSASPTAERAARRGEAILAGAQIDHVHGARSPVDPRHETVVAMLEVVERHERRAQLAGESLMLPPARSGRPVGQDHRARVVGARRRGVAQRERQLAERQGNVGLRRLRAEQVAHRVPRRHRVRHPRRHAHLVLDHAKAAVRAPHDIEAGERDPLRRRGAAHGRLVVRRGLDILAREQAGVEHAPVRVHVGHERLEREQALGDPRL
jgi:hypothetical protein